MKKIIFCLALFCLMAVNVNAASIGIVVDFPDGKLIKNCVDIEDNADGYKVLEGADLDILWSSPGTFGHALCRIEGAGDNAAGTACAWGNNYWGFFIADNNQWSYMPVGYDAPGGCWNRDFNSFGGHYCAKNGDVLGFRYGEFGVLPRFFSYNDICNFGITKVDVEPKKPKPGEKLKVDVSLENDFAFDLKNIKLNVWFQDSKGNKLKDDDNNVIEDDSSFDLDAGDDESDLDEEDIAFEFEMPFDVDDKDEYYVYASLEAKQSNDSRIIYRDIDFSKTIKFSKEKHEIEIYKFQANPAEVKCSRNAAFELGLRNLGEDDEKVTIKILSQELGIDKTESIELSSNADDNSYSNSYPFKIKDDALPAEYIVPIRVIYDDSTDAAAKTAIINLLDCGKSSSQQSIQLEAPKNEMQPPVQQTQLKTSTEIKTNSKNNKASFNSYILPIALGWLIIIIFGGLALAKLLIK